MKKIQLRRRQLTLYNGQDKPKIYVAFQQKIYDVTGSRHWRKGQHYGHWAGQDLTDELADAPHGEEVFSRYPCVGELIS